MLEKIVNNPAAIALGIIMFVVLCIGVRVGWTMGLEHFSQPASDLTQPKNMTAQPQHK